MKKLVLIILVLAAFGTAVWLGLQSKPAPAAPAGLPTNVAAGDDANSPAPAETSRTPRVFRHRERSNAGETDPLEVWDKQIDAVLASPGTAAEIADKLLQLYPQVPTNGQADLILEIAPRVSNDSYGKLSGILTNAASTGEVVDTLLTDLIDRPDKVRLPVLLDLARTKDNPKSEDAHDLLEVILGDDYGEDWAQWSKKISEWMASHPEKE